MDVLILAADDYTHNCTFGVIPVDMNSTFEGIQRALLKMKDKLPTVEKPKLNMIYAECANVMSRVEVLATDPLYLRYLDFGFDEIKDSYCNLRSIPPSLAQIEPVAFKITVKNCGLELREGQTICIKILESVSERHYFVEVTDLDLLSDSLTQYDSASEANTTFCEMINSPQNSEKNKEADLTKPLLPTEHDGGNDDHRSEIGSVNTEVLCQDFLTTHPTLPTKYHIDNVSVNTSFALTVMNTLNDSRCTGMVMQTTYSHLLFMKKYLKNLKADPSYRPKVGDIIAALFPDSDVWSRAVVLSEPTNLKTNYRVAMFDVGCVHEVEEIAPLNEYYRDLGNLSVYCEIKGFPPSKKPLKLFKAYKCRITEKLKDGTITGSIEAKTNQMYEVCFKPWTPTIDELGVSRMPLSNNSRVKITAYNTSNTCHVCLKDRESDRIGNLFISDVIDFCDLAEPMTEEPFISEIVGVETESGSFWRGRVLEKLENTYSIFLLDRGTKCTARLEQLRSLAYTPDSSPFHKNLKTSFALAIPVTLKNVPATDIPAEISSYMRNAIEKEYQFDVLIDEATGEVELKFLKGTTLNEHLANSLIPEWKKFLKDPATIYDGLLDAQYFITDIRYDELAVGSKVSLYVTAVTDTEFSAVNKNGKNYMKLLEVNLFERLAEYATTVTASYVPSRTELCIAEHENTWHRAVCLESKPNSDIAVQLIDDGPLVLVSHKNIRKMISEFYHYVATSLICRPKDEIKFDKKQCAALLNDTIRVKVLEKEEPNEYVVDCRKIFANL